MLLWAKVWGPAGGFLEAGKKCGFCGKRERRRKTFRQTLDRFVCRGVQDPGLCGWGQSGLHGSIQGLNLAQDWSIELKMGQTFAQHR